MNGGASFLVSKLVIQNLSLPSDKVVRDGISRTTHTAVKNSPFTIQLGLDNKTLYDSNTLEVVQVPKTPPLNLTHVALDAKLLYDNQEEKEVDFVKHKPMEFKVMMNENGDEATIECRLKVLTSQLEDMLFKIKFRALEPVSKQEICNLLVVTTGPIKVISKPERQNKKPRSTNKKRTTNDVLLETLASISEKQRRQQDVLQKLLSDLQNGILMAPSGGSLTNTLTGSMSSMTSSLNLNSALPTDSNNVNSNDQANFHSWKPDTEEPPKKKKKIDDFPIDFETAFRDLMDSFRSLTTTDRFDNIKHFITQNPSASSELSELHDMLSEGLGRPIGIVEQTQNAPANINTPLALNHSEQECTCEGCPHREEYIRTTAFYAECFLNEN